MTAVYGFISTKNNLAFLGADNIEFNEKRTVEKVFLIQSRYAIATIGADSTIHAVAIIQQRDNKVQKEIIDNLGVLANKILFYTKIIMDILYPQYKMALDSGKIPPENWDCLLRNTTKLVAIDYQEYRICSIEYGSFYPPSKALVNPEITYLENDELHLFEYATTRGTHYEMFPIKNELLENPEKEIGNMLRISKIRNPDIVGTLGSIVKGSKNNPKYYSVFKTTEEQIKNEIKYYQGFEINVLKSVVSG